MNGSQIHPALAALQGSLPRPSVDVAYRLGLLLVAIAMVVLPLIYIALIVAVAYVLLLYLMVAPLLFGFELTDGFVLIFKALAFLTPIVAGVVMIFFMVKPLFARQATRAEPRTLDRSRQKDLFDFVDRLCDMLGAPKPQRIDVDCSLNAFASFDGAGWGLGSRHRLVLTIGLPLAAGLDLRGLAGVLAHEFGHFAQGAGMRLSYVIRSVNIWFARVVYERDEWDTKLAMSAASDDIRIALIFRISRLFVFLTRRVLFALMMVGHGISCYMMRQMEFDADRYEARLSGAESFELTMLRYHRLSAATQQTNDILGYSWSQGHLPDNLPELVARLAERLPPEVEASIEEALRRGTTRLLDTHPAEAQRIARARREPAEGIFQVEGPARALFEDFEGLSREVTLRAYREIVGDKLEEVQLTPVTAVLDANAVLRDQQASLARVFAGGLSILRPVWLAGEIGPCDDWERERTVFRDSKRVMTERAVGAKEALETYAREEERRMKASAAIPLLELDVPIRVRDFGLAKAHVRAADQAILDAEARLAEVAPEVDTYLEVAGAWLASALRLLSHPRAVQHIGRSNVIEPDSDSLINALSCLRESHRDVLRLGDAYTTFEAFLHTVAGSVQREPVWKKLDELKLQLTVQLGKLRDGLDAAYPFQHASGPITIGDQVVGKEIERLDDLGALYAQAGGALERYLQLYFRLLGALTRAAEALEGDAG